MPYLGQIPTNGFHTKQTISGDGSTVTFTLNHTVGNESSLVVSVDGTILEPKHGYDLAGGGSKITFATAPASNVRTYVQFLGQAVVNNLLDMNGTELVLDEDADTSLTADTDDEIDIKVAGSDRSTIKATGFHNLDSVKFVAGTGDDMQMYHDGSNSYLTNSTGALKLATETSGIAITLGHSTSEVTVGDNLTVTGDLTVGGNANFGDFNITNVGSIALDTITNDGTDITLDSSGDIILDAGGNDLIFKDSGTEIGRFANTSSDLVIKSAISDQDLILKGNDGGSEISALTFDMSAAGKATFNDQVVIGDGKLVLGSTAVTSTAAELNLLDGVSGLVQADLTKLAAVDSTAAELNIVDGGTSATSTTVADADRVVMNDNGTMVQVAVTDLAAYFDDEITAMPNLASVGTLTALTVDDVAIDGKVMTMTGSSSDTAVFTAGTNGTLSIVTTDAAAAAANIQITADGTAELAGTTVTLNSSGGITLDADNGTITFADAGSSLGTITSSGYSGTAAAATTVTITDNESTDENNVLVFVAGADSDGGTGLGLESDGNLTYNPSTGTLSATNLVVTGTQTITNSVTMNASNAVVFEGATADAHETTLTTIDATGDRTISLPNVSGTLPVLAAVSATAITSTPAELNLIDGGTARGTDAVASGDGILINDGGTMKMTNVDTVSTYFASHSVGGGNIVTTGALNSGSITSGFGTINNGSSTITTTGAVATGAITAGGNIIIPNAGNIGSAGDTDALAIASNGVVTFSQIPVMPANSIDSDEYIDGSIDREHLAADIVDGTKIADDAINSEHYTDGSIDTAHIADLNVTGAKLALDHRSSGNADDVKTGNQHDYIFFDGDVGISFFTANAEDMRLEDDGDLHVDKDVIAFSTTISDERLKENIQPIEDALSKVGQLNGVTFTYKADGKESAGLIAQDVEKVLPSAITEKQLPLKVDDGNEYKVLQYDQTIGLLVEAIKELTAKVEELENK